MKIRIVEGKLLINGYLVESVEAGHKMVRAAQRFGLITDSRLAVQYRTIISQYFANPKNQIGN